MRNLYQIINYPICLSLFIATTFTNNAAIAQADTTLQILLSTQPQSAGPFGLYGTGDVNGSLFGYLFPLDLDMNADPNQGSYPVISPNKTMFARFEQRLGERLLFIRKLSDGTVLKEFSINGYDPQWFRDSRKILYYLPAAPGVDELWTVDIETGALNFLIAVNHLYPSAPSLSPDSRRVIYHKRISVGGPPYDFITPYVLDIQTGQEQPLYPWNASGTLDGSALNKAYLSTLPAYPRFHIAWSPDGQRVALTAYLGIDNDGLPGPELFRHGLFAIDFNQKLALLKETQSNDYKPVSYFFSRKGDQLVYEDNVFESALGYSVPHIFVMPAYGGNAQDLGRGSIVALTADRHWPLNPWSPDSKHILFKKYEDNSLWRISSDGVKSAQLTPQLITLQSAQWMEQPEFVDLSIHWVNIIQPVQVSWQYDPGSTAEYPASDDMQQINERSWQANFPLVKNKLTRFFGHSPGDFEARRSIRLRLENNTFTSKTVRIHFIAVDDDNTVHTIQLSAPYVIPPTGSIDTNGYLMVKLDAPLPTAALPFKFPHAGNWLISAVLTNSENTYWLFDTDNKNNWVDVSANVRATQEFRVLFRPMVFIDDGQAILAANPNFFETLTSHSESDWWNNPQYLEGIFPLADGGYHPAYYIMPMHISRLYWSLSNSPDEVTTLSQWRQLFNSNTKIRHLENLAGQTIDLNKLKRNYDRIVILLPPTLLHNSVIAGIVTGLHFPAIKKVVFVHWREGSPGATDEGQTLLHELGHSFKLYSVGEPEQYEIAQDARGFRSFGYWVKPVPSVPFSDSDPSYRDSAPFIPGVPHSFYSFMGTAGPRSEAWIAKPDYRELLDEFSKTSLDPELLLVRGEIYPNGQFDALPWYELEGIPELEPNAAGEYKIVLVDAVGNDIGAYGFHPSFQFHADPIGIEPLESSYVSLTVPFNPDAARVQIRNNAAQVVFERYVSLHKPVIKITNFQTGDTITQSNLLIKWDASDPDGDSLTYSVFLSPNDGEDWSIMAADIKSKEYNFPGPLSSLSDKYRIAIFATDGIHTSDDEIGPLVVTDLNNVSPDPSFLSWQISPHPVYETTKISFHLEQAMRVTLELFSLTGQHMVTLSDSECAAGEHTITWNPADIASGVYILRIKGGNTSQAKKIVILK